MKNKLLLLVIGFAITSQMIIAQVPSYVPTNGLAGWWSFSGNANDASTNANNGTVILATLTTDRFGNANSAYSFDGSRSYIQCTSNITNVDNITISGWAKNNQPWGGQFVQIGQDDAFSSNGIGVGKGGISSIGVYSFSKLYKGNNLLTLITGDFCYDSTYLLNLNSWFHFVITYTNKTISYYVNGILVSSIPTYLQRTIPPNSKIFFGSSGPLEYTHCYDGNLDDIGIWNRALTQDEISSLYSGVLGFNPLIYKNALTIYPNPANDHITIDCGNLSDVIGQTIKIFNILGQEVFGGAINQQQYIVPLNTWGGAGVYLVKIYDGSNNLLDTKKIILQ